MTTTVVAVMHDAHVCARATFVAARTAMVQVATTRRAAKAARNAAYAANRRATKAQRAANVAAKEAAEKHASIVRAWTARCAARAAARAAAAPMVRAAKKQAACIAKVVRAMRTAAILAVRATRMAAKATAVVVAAKAAIDKAYALSVAPCTPVVAPATVNVYSIVAFLAMTPCLVALWFMATFDIAVHASDKEDAKATAKAANKVHARIRAPRVPMNDEAKRASITLACANARASKAAKHAADAHAIALVGSVMSQRTIDARIAQGVEQREWNATRKANALRKAAHKEIKALERSIMGVTPVVQVRVVRNPIVAKLEGAHVKDKANRRLVANKQCSYPEAAGFRTSKLHPVMAPKTEANKAKREAAEKAAALVAARKAAKRLSREEWLLQKAHRQALKEQYIALRIAKVNRICTEVWYKQGVWVDTFLVRACNDSNHDTRVAAMTELLALVGVAA